MKDYQNYGINDYHNFKDNFLNMVLRKSINVSLQLDFMCEKIEGTIRIDEISKLGKII